jgi:RNA polymerase sigma-70 factor (ECF subfamily)
MPVNLKGRVSMAPDGEDVPRDAERLLERLHAERNKYLTFVRWRSVAVLSARRDPEDILQLAFVNAHERWQDFGRSGMPLDAWFYRIILNTLFDDHDFQSRQRRDYRAEKMWPDRSSAQFAMGLKNADTSPSEAFNRREVKERIDEVLRELPADQQQIMVLIHYAELNKEQAAELLGIESNTARQRYARARVRFREVWKSLFGEEGFGG